jgi:GT2 family glycosyltransferase
VVATRDAPRHLAAFLASLRATAPDAELVIVDNGTVDATARRLLEDAERAGATVLHDDRPFNFAALANRGAAAASRDRLVFANNDIVFTRADWLDRLVEPLADEGVGVTGARLLYPDGRVQHGGIVLAGEARVRHAERFLPWWRRGHEGRQRRTVPVTGVTAALMATPRAVFVGLGGFDAARYGVLYNDIDYCLRARARGLSVLYVAGAEAVHAESVTIGPRQRRDPFARGGALWRLWRAAEADQFRGDWAALLDRDPCYPPDLDPVEAVFAPRPRR